MVLLFSSFLLRKTDGGAGGGGKKKPVTNVRKVSLTIEPFFSPFFLFISLDEFELLFF